MRSHLCMVETPEWSARRVQGEHREKKRSANGFCYFCNSLHPFSSNLLLFEFLTINLQQCMSMMQNFTSVLLISSFTLRSQFKPVHQGIVTGFQGSQEQGSTHFGFGALEILLMFLMFLILFSFFFNF